MAQFCQDHDRNLFEVFKKQLMKFDLVCYYAILTYVYDIRIKDEMSREEVEKEMSRRIKESRANKYLQYMHDKFKISLFETEKKIIKLVNFLKKKEVDVVFLQDTCEKSLELLDMYCQDYRFCGMGSDSKCAILIKQTLIAKFEPKRKHLPLQQLNMRYVQNV